MVLVAFLSALRVLFNGWLIYICFDDDDLSNDYFIKPQKGKSVLFYDQLPNGTLLYCLGIDSWLYIAAFDMIYNINDGYFECLTPQGKLMRLADMVHALS